MSDSPFNERIRVLVEPSLGAPSNLVWSEDGKVLAFNRLMKNEAGKGVQQVFVLRMN